ncbi:hypothetical protein AB6A40_007399 [Gnathostoma spinigerum]|uniref:Uncharacterized protein n=1 Tax=Gnathostoma spinigerum TaxID=75299 RepID=A0ABD6EL39_9BILA
METQLFLLQYVLPYFSSSSDSSDSESETTRRNVHSTMWIGNDDGEIFVFNFLDNVRLKSKEKLTRLPFPIDDIAYIDERVFVSMSSTTPLGAQLIYFQRGKDGNWDLENSATVELDLKSRLKPMIAAASRLCIASANSLYLLNPISTVIEKHAQLSSFPSESVGNMVIHGSTIFISLNRSTIVKVVNAFTLECLLEFTVSHVVSKALSTCDNIIRQHKMGCLRISALLCCKNRLWIGTSAGVVLSTNVASTKSNWTPTFSVCAAGHSGPCRFLTAVSVSTSAQEAGIRRRRMSLNLPSLQQLDQMFVISGGEGFDTIDIRETKRGAEDAVNHLLFWNA